MNRKLFCVILTLVLLLTGCSGSGDQITEPADIQDNVQTGFALGNQMPDLTVTTAEGETFVLSELLRQKKMVVLNFWYADCIWCVREFPVMEASYQKFKQDVEILALNPFDSSDQIASFQQDHSLSFPMASCNRDLTLAFGISGYPTSVVIDREGKICLIHPGAITETQIFDRLFETFCAPNYTSQTYYSISDLL